MKISESALFKDMTPLEIAAALKQMNVTQRSYQKGEMIMMAGDTGRRLGLIQSGSVTIENDDLWGNRTILSLLGEGEFFAEVYAILNSRSARKGPKSLEPLLINVCANEPCRILFLELPDPSRLQDSAPSWFLKFQHNLLLISARKNLNQSRRAFHTSPKSIRGRIMAYLDTVSVQKHCRSFDIPFDRQQLADYLNVERSALSKELGKMKKDGLIDFHKNHFEVL